MAKAADFSGHCQACGRLQKLPNGVLAKHGYKIAAGYFSGVCAGSGHLPFEKSYDMLPGFIASASAQLTSVERFVAKLTTPATEPKAWFYTSKASPRGGYYGSTRDWQEQAIETEVVQFHDGTGSYKKFWRDGDTSWERFRNAEGARTEEIRPVKREVSAGYDDAVLDVATKANGVYARWMRAEVLSLRRYIAWQQERIASWKEADLLPVDRKDKEGFKPTEAAY